MPKVKNMENFMTSVFRRKIKQNLILPNIDRPLINESALSLSKQRLLDNIQIDEI